MSAFIQQLPALIGVMPARLITLDSLPQGEAVILIERSLRLADPGGDEREAAGARREAG